MTNTGGVPAGSGTALAAALGGANASDFTIVTSNCAGALPGGSTCMVVVAFAPKSAGNKTASLSVSATPGGAAVAAFSGAAQNIARLAVTVASGSSTAFGNVLVGSTSDKTFVVNNTGDQTTSAIGLTLSSAAGSGFTLLRAGHRRVHERRDHAARRWQLQRARPLRADRGGDAERDAGRERDHRRNRHAGVDRRRAAGVRAHRHEQQQLRHGGHRQHHRHRQLDHLQ